MPRVLRRGARLRVRARSPYRPKITLADPAAAPSPNLLTQAGSAEKPGTHLVSDITGVPTREGWLYLAVVSDLFSRAILGGSVAETMCPPASSPTRSSAPSTAAGWQEGRASTLTGEASATPR